MSAEPRHEVDAPASPAKELLLSTNLASPWDYLQPWDVQRFGEIILNVPEQERWSRAVFLGGLPYMWRKAQAMRDMVYDRMALRPGDRVLLLGESLEPCGFVDDIRARIGPTGEIRIIEIVDEARDAYQKKERGSGGQIATWRFGYTKDVPDQYFDTVAVLQGVQHADDWRAVGSELLRVMKPGRAIILAEITFGPNFRHRIAADVHIEYLFEKIFSRIGWTLDEFPYYSPEQLVEAFRDLVDSPQTFEWRGFELFWGMKPIKESP